MESLRSGDVKITTKHGTTIRDLNRDLERLDSEDARLDGRSLQHIRADIDAFRIILLLPRHFVPSDPGRNALNAFGALIYFCRRAKKVEVDLIHVRKKRRGVSRLPAPPAVLARDRAPILLPALSGTLHLPEACAS